MSPRRTGDLGGPWVAGLLLAAALAGCLAPNAGPGPGPGSAQDDGPPYVVTVQSRYVPEVNLTEHQDEEGGLDPARLPNGTVATFPMYVSFTVGEPSALHGGRAREEARTGWAYDDACPRASNHAPRRVRDNECDGHPVRERVVVPPLYPEDRAENYSKFRDSESSKVWVGRGYHFSTLNGSKYWNYTKGFSGRVPVDINGSVRLVFHHRVPIEVRIGYPYGEIPEWMDEEVIEPENCTSPPDEPYDYVKGAEGQTAELHGGIERNPDGRGFLLRGDARVVTEWSAVCVRDQRHMQV